jgi:hypothetical protein
MEIIQSRDRVRRRDPADPIRRDYQILPSGPAMRPLLSAGIGNPLLQRSLRETSLFDLMVVLL